MATRLLGHMVNGITRLLGHLVNGTTRLLGHMVNGTTRSLGPLLPGSDLRTSAKLPVGEIGQWNIPPIRITRACPSVVPISGAYIFGVLG